MNVFTLFLFYVGTMFGLAYIVGHSTITLGIREEMTRWMFVRRLVDLLECPACFGFWCGVTAALIGAVPFDVEIANMIAWGLFTSGSNYAIAKITRLID